jgi:hypothetical protein
VTTSSSCSESCIGSSSQSCTVPVNCVWNWSDTATCSVTCGWWQIQEVYSITTPAANGWTACPFSNGATRWRSGSSCNTWTCAVPVNCVWSWSAYGSCNRVQGSWLWSGCHVGCGECFSDIKSRTYTITTPASNGGAACPFANWTVEKVGCGTWACSSFLAWTKVRMSDGTLKSIQDIEVWDRVVWSEWINTVKELKFHPHQWKVYKINNGDYFVTPGHPFMTDRWRVAFDEKLAMIINPTLEIKKLEIWDVLHLESWIQKLESFDSTEMMTQVYNFEVSWSRDYYADWFLVHNK